ncbi:MAG: TrbG/VirB9 family P-type conjugative transfer protein [Steroidobacteraceae bacterium]
MLLVCALGTAQAQTQIPAISTRADSRIRTMVYSADEVYRLRGFVGYQIDLQFERGESFVGLGAGDVDALAFAAQDNHLFVKPKAAKVRTNLTVLTTRRVYQFDYDVASSASPDANQNEVIYTLRFAYPPVSSPAAGPRGADAALDHASNSLPMNRDYWYCGHPALQPLEAFDDGVHTHLRFDPSGELPALFLGNEDGSESLLNFSMQQGELVIHRVARRLVVRRGRLSGCIVNHGFAGVGHELRSGTVSTDVERGTRPAVP